MHEMNLELGNDMPLDGMPSLADNTEMALVKGSPALAQALAKLVGSLFVFRAEAHGFHWNVKGRDFNEYHEFFGEIYQTADGFLDDAAESILKLGYDAPYLLSDFIELSCIEQRERVTTGDIQQMSQILLADNAKLVKESKEAFDCANSCNEQGIANFLAGVIEAHQKIQWKLRASLNVQ
jgi:starvation-inducible DNA-binding protein